VALCPGVTVDPSGVEESSAQFQQCVDATAAGGVLSVPAGTYNIGTTIQLDHPVTITTAGTAGSSGCLSSGGPSCAVLRAGEALAAYILDMKGSRVVIDHMVIDGNRANRLSGPASQACASGNNQPGININVGGCIGCAFISSGSINAVCGSGQQWVGAECTLTDNLIADNGDHYTKNMWSDGLTLLDGDGCSVTGNSFSGNSDVNLILGR
jgi:hypothetical protein